jgi:hypothetical protein
MEWNKVLVFGLNLKRRTDFLSSSSNKKKVVILGDVHKEDVYHAVSRRHRHVTLLAYFSAAGDALNPMLVAGSLILDSFWTVGLGQDEDVLIRRRNPAYLDKEVFYEYISGVLIHHVSSLRSRPELIDPLAVLLLDSALPHTSERILRIFGENNVIALTFPALTMNIFQALDLVFFGSL